ncbi:MAG: hypothetical protein EXS36_14715 [Pedosphaera sp.]|nr:hypothetical protein [Pedosphaera sp.]
MRPVSIGNRPLIVAETVYTLESYLDSANVAEIQVLPDGEWVAWAERFNVYRTPLLMIGHELGP